MGRARDIANVLSSSTNIALDSEVGLVPITPTSIATTGGSGSISTSGAVSFTSASAISLNGIFSSTYRAYRLIFDGSLSGGAGHLQARLRSSGTDNTSNLYYSGYWYVNLSNSANGTDVSNVTTSFTRLGYVNFAGRISTAYDIQNPFESVQTTITGMQTRLDAVTIMIGGDFDATTSFDGISFISGNGTFTGTLRVYGYRN